MFAAISNLFRSLIKVLNMANRAIDSADAVLEVVEIHAYNFRDAEVADLRSKESPGQKEQRVERIKVKLEAA